MGEKERDWRGKQVLAARPLMEEVILGHFQLKLQGKHAANSITEVAGMEINETNKIRELNRLICEFPETPKSIDLEMKQETENEWQAL